jgi:hypothetical protein
VVKGRGGRVEDGRGVAVAVSSAAAMGLDEGAGVGLVSASRNWPLHSLPIHIRGAGRPPARARGVLGAARHAHYCSDVNCASGPVHTGEL